MGDVLAALLGLGAQLLQKQEEQTACLAILPPLLGVAILGLSELRRKRSALSR